MAKELTVGSKAPAFTLSTDHQNTDKSGEAGKVSLKSLSGKKVVLYFYPKDDTPGCTKQAIGFSELEKKFAKANTVILGVSKDTLEKHAKFRTKHDLTIPLGSDEEGKIIEKYGAWVEKNMYGKKYMGIERSTFLIDEKGIIREIWRKVRVNGHMEKVLEAAKAL